MKLYTDLNQKLTPEQLALKEETHRFAREVLRPASVELDKLSPEEVIAEGSVYWDVWRQARQIGLHRQGLPEHLGGVTLDPVSSHIVTEELGWGSVDFAVGFGAGSMPFTFALLIGNERLINEVAIPFAEDTEGKLIGCWAITEPAHGSDVIMSLESGGRFRYDTKAFLDGDEWVIRGQKSAWVSNGTVATHALTFVSIDAGDGESGTGICVVPLDLPGISRGKPLNKLGQRALNQGEIFFDDVRIHRDYMMFRPDAEAEQASPVGEMILAAANSGMAVIFLGLARAALEEALAYCKDRVQGGKPICEHQLVQKKLFEMFTKVELARAYTRAVRDYNRATFPPQAQYSVAAKVYCTEMAFEVASDAIQLLGGYGLSKEMVIEKLFRDARAAMIEDGANEVLSLTAARSLIERYPT